MSATVNILLRAVLLLALTATVDVCTADEFHSPTYGYRLDLPADWVQIPSDLLQETLATLLKDEPQVLVIWDAGFQPDAAPAWLEYPYVLVQPIPYTDHQIHEDEFPQYVQSLTGVHASNLLESHLRPQARGLFDGIRVDDVVLDQPNRRFIWMTELDVPDIGKVRGLIVGHFGSDSIVQVMFYSLASQWKQYAPVRESIIDSFRFDAHKAYNPQLASANRSRSASGGAQAAMLGMIMGGLGGGIVAAVVVFKKKSRKAA